MPLLIRQFSIKAYYFQGNDGSLAVLTVLDDQLDADLNYYEPDILLHIESCGRGTDVVFLKSSMQNHVNPASHFGLTADVLYHAT